MPKRIGKVFTSAMRDAGRARQRATDPAFRRELQKDRRGTLREFETVEHALQDRAKAQRATTKKKK